MKAVVCMRKDLNMRKGKMVAQAFHTGLYMLLDHLFYGANVGGKTKIANSTLKEWMDDGHTTICVGLDSHAQLKTVAFKAAELGIPTYIQTDEGLTEVPSQTETCVLLGPAPEELIDQITSKLTLL